MELVGKIILDFPLVEGVSQRGNAWKKKEYVCETFSTYPKKVKFHIFGEKAVSLPLEIGKCYNLSVDVESREFNGRWYTDVSVFAAYEVPEPTPSGAFGQPMGNSFGAPAMPQSAPVAPTAAPVAPAPDPFAAPAGDSSDDLPF